MAVYCASCGGELFGAVNRCWHCRRSFAKPPSQDGRPAVRRAPVIVEGLVPSGEPLVIGDDKPGGPKSQEKPANSAAKPSIAEKTTEEKADEKMAVGSPFSAGWTMPRVERGRAAPSPTADMYADPDADEAGRWSALLAVVCGAGGLIGSAYFPWPILAAWVGLTIGTLGLKNFRALAIAGIFLCCAVLFVQGLFMASALYESVFRVDPWSAIFSP